jgi:ArsR family transcriptional regulator, arsenate/arsenite/antimonite-responsive transcriptional repressor
MRMNPQSSDTLNHCTELFKACADQVRLRLLSLLANDEICVCHLHEALELPQSTVSRHLAYLRRRRLVLARKQGLWVYYRLARPAGGLHRRLLAWIKRCSREDPTFMEDRERLARRIGCDG